MYLRKNNKQKIYKVHRLVALAFLPNYDSAKNEVNHKDEDKTNNYVNNLEWCTHTYNTRYSCAHPIAQYDLNDNLIRIFESIRQAAQLTKTDRKSIALCAKQEKNYKTANGFIWKYA